MNVFTLIQYDSAFMSHDIRKLHIATTNKQVLEAVLRDCEVLSPESTFSIKMIEVDGKSNAIKYQTDSDTDLNYCYERDIVDVDEFKRELDIYEMPVKHSVTKLDRRSIYAHLCTDWERKLNEHRHKKRKMSSGEYWNNYNYGY